MVYQFLKGINVIQFQGLAPTVYIASFLADSGANITIACKPLPQPFSIPIQSTYLNRNKSTVIINLKQKQSLKKLKEMLKQTDIVIDPYRPGILQKNGIGPQEIWKINQKVIILRVTGYGQEGDKASKPGHDINYLGQSGILNYLTSKKEKLPLFPNNLACDFAGANFGILGVLTALIQRKKTGKGCIVDCSLTHSIMFASEQLINKELYSSNISKNYNKMEDVLNDRQLKQKNVIIDGSKGLQINSPITSSLLNFRQNRKQKQRPKL